jgi:hypothetical protein
MALRINRFNAQGHNAGIFAGGAEAWAIKRLHLNVNMYAGQGGIDDKSGIPNGYNTGLYLLPLKAGGMSSYNPAILNLVKANADAKLGLGMVASSSLVLTVVNAQADQIVSLEGSASLALTVSNGDLSAGVQAEGTGALAITGTAQLGGIIPVEASASCVITPSVTMSALANMEAEAGGPTPLSPEGLADAVWDELLSDHLNAGSTGEALSNAGGAGNPWDSLLSANNDPGTFGERVQKILTKNQFIGLK